MRRDTLALIVIALCCGCQSQGRPTNDPFWGRTRVPPPGTGAAGSPGDPYYNRQPAPLGPQALPPGATTPTGVPPVMGGATYNYSPPTSTPAAVVSTPASPSYGRPISSYGSPAASTNAMPVSATPQSLPTTPNYPVPNYSSPVNSMPSSPASAQPGSSPPPGYLPPSGMNYQGSSYRPGSTWTAAASDPNVIQASATVPSDSNMDTTPSVIRIPEAASAGSGAGESLPMPADTTGSTPAPAMTATRSGSGG